MSEFLTWCESIGVISLPDIQPLHVFASALKDGLMTLAGMVLGTGLAVLLGVVAEVLATSIAALV